MKKLLILPLFTFFACSQSGSLELLEPEVEASAGIYSLTTVGENVYTVENTNIGSAHFSQTGDIVTLEITLQGMTPNSSKAVHLHNGSVSSPGRHWNQQSFYAFCSELSMGQVWSKTFAGDVGNVPINSEGNGSLILQTDLWALNSGDKKDILDKVIIVHADPEDFAEECDPNHSHNYLHSNVKIGGGKIVLLTEIEQKAQFSNTNFPDFTICN